MKYITNTTTFIAENTAIALGKFDGLHKGHQLLFDEILDCKKDGLTSMVFTFDRQPGSIITGKEDGSIHTKAERKQYLESLGIDILMEYPFTKEFSQMEPKDFVEKILLHQMGMKVLVVGEDFCFGKNRIGNVALLSRLSEQFGFTLKVKTKKEYEDTVISSTYIKDCITRGDMELVSELMGMPYSISGTVVEGNKLGRTMNFPTANLWIPEGKTIPPFGVYAVKVMVGEKLYSGIANLGKKPTVEEMGTVGLETYIFNFNQDVYGRDIKVELCHFLRQEQKFSDLNALSLQIQKDIEQAQAYSIKEA